MLIDPAKTESEGGDSFNSGREITLLIGLLLAITISGGCRLHSGQLRASPWDYSRQAQAVLKITPLGTPRDECIKKLKQAGIKGSFGLRETIYYCNTWQRNPEVRWHLNVSLFFDGDGNLYATRPSNAETSIVSEQSVFNDNSDGPFQESLHNALVNSSDSSTDPAIAQPPPGKQTTPEISSGETQTKPARLGRRTPFGEAESDPR